MAFDVNGHWYRRNPSWLSYLLLPLSYLYRSIIFLRKQSYILGLQKKKHFSVPVIVVGNITVGGTGKTPLVIWLSQCLKAEGFQPGIVSRGFGGKETEIPVVVTENSDPSLCGDEALLLAKRANAPIVVCRDRVKAVNFLLEKYPCNIILSDDGLQHYRLARSIEIALIDGARRFGNAFLLPAGPLREPLSRLKSVDFIVTQGQAKAGEYDMLLEGDTLVSMQSPDKKMEVDHFKNQSVHAVAGIGNPERFFSRLMASDLDIIPHPFSDHYPYQKEDFHFQDDKPIVMTEKDAVKCFHFADERFWYLPVSASLPKALKTAILHKLQQDPLLTRMKGSKDEN